MELLLPRVPHQQTETGMAFLSLGGQSPKAKPPLGLLTPNKGDYVSPANQIFSIFFFLNLYSLSF